MSTSAEPQSRQIGPFGSFLWSIVIGVVGALGAVVFRGLIALFHNLLFLGQLSFDYNANLHTAPSPWGPFIILVPVLGALGVAFLVSNFAPEAKGHGVPEVMDAIYHHGGVVRPIVAVIKSLASALSIGSGGSIGREGPIIQIGASFGSTLGGLLRMPPWERITLIAAGGGAGIAATFNTPVGGVLFAVEIMLHEVSARTLVPVTIATVTSSYVARLVFGNHPSFVIPPLATPITDPTDWLVLLCYPGLGVLTGLVSFAYIRSIYAFEDFFEQRVPGNYYTRHMLGMLGVGIIIYVLLLTTGHYYVEGVGYATVQDVLSGKLSWFLLVLAALKLVTTSLTLGSGASGGVFSPALFMGATVGGVYGMIINTLFPALHVDPAAFAVAGMAGVVGGSTGAALAAVVMIFEMTSDYKVIIPMTITVALSYGVRKILLPDSIYTLKLSRRGHEVPDTLQADLYRLRKTRDVMDTHFMTVPDSDTLADFERRAKQQADVCCFVVEGPNGPIGLLTREAALCQPDGHPEKTLADLADPNFVTVTGSTPLSEVMARMRHRRASVALVLSGDGKPSGKIQGVITGRQIANVAIDGMDLFST